MSMFSMISSGVLPGARHRRLERIEVAHDQVDRLDAVFLQRGPVLGIVAHGEDAAVDVRMQRLDPAVEHLRKAGDLGDLAHRQAGLGKRLARASRGDQLDCQGRQGRGRNRPGRSCR